MPETLTETATYMTEQEEIEALKSQLLRREIERHNPVDADVVAMLVGRFGVAADGRLVVQDDNGVPVVGDGPGYTMSVSEKIDALAKNRPALFREKSGAADGSSEYGVVVDPAKPGFNLTAALAAARNNPEVHAELIARLAPRKA